MPEAERRFSMSRLEAFSDGVIAVIITIMVLELKAPDARAGSAPEALALIRDLSRQLRIRGDLLDQSSQFACARWPCHGSAHLGQQRALVLSVAHPLRLRLRCGHTSRLVPDDGLRRAAVRLRAGLQLGLSNDCPAAGGQPTA